MFTTDDQTHFSWFQPASLEPLHKFEALGLLTSLAVFNGLTVPSNFPLVLYRKLLGLSVSIDDIEDAWSELQKSLRGLLKCTGGDVESLCLSFLFTLRTPLSSIDINMELEPGPRGPIDTRASKARAEAASTVTRHNRKQYVQDYILWLTHKSIGPQYSAFEKGFYTLLDRKAVALFSPSSLKLLVEGSPEIDVDDLERAATYEGYSTEDDTIKDFWHVVRSFSPEQLRKLLEFVTASDRVPFGGFSSIKFSIHRNGNEDERLPRSSTCFGQLLLPQYSSRDRMRERLCLAIENSQGFGNM